MTTSVTPSITTLATTLLKKENATTSELLSQITTSSEVAVRPAPKLPQPKGFELAETQREALQALADAEGLGVVVPKTRRVLSPAEIKRYIHLLDHLRVAEAAVKKVRENVKLVAHGHFDSTLEASGEINEHTPFHPTSGWYAVADDTSGQVPGEAQKLVRETSGGGVNLTLEGLQLLLKQGKLTTEQFNSFTEIVPQTVLNHTAIIAAIAKDESIANTLLDVADVVAPTPSITLRPAK